MVHQTNTAGSATVGDLVADLDAAFARTTRLYTQWRTRREHANHYRRPGAAAAAAAADDAAAAASSGGALAASLALGQHVRAVYNVGLATLGSDFCRGDHAARRALAAQRDLLHDQVAVLRAAVAAAAAAGPLDIRDILHAAETARTAAVQALVDQYRRMALARPGVPRDLPMPRRGGPAGAAVAAVAVAAAPPAAAARPDDDDTRTTAWSVLSGPLVFQSEPPSPPLTPKDLALLPPVPPLPAAFRAAVQRQQTVDNDDDNDDAATTITATTRLTSVTRHSGTPARPTNSVFNIFCPGAMALQVDVQRPVPPERRCRWCGFRWDGGSVPMATAAAAAAGDRRSGLGGRDSPAAAALSVSTSSSASSSLSSLLAPNAPSSSPAAAAAAASSSTLLLKEGFRLSRRFLAKSHCEGDADCAGTASPSPSPGTGPGPGGPGSGAAFCYGCVLCTSTGLAQTYPSAEALRVHINAAHSKWQMLHDRDLT